MIRDALADSVYWEKWIAFHEKDIEECARTLEQPARNPDYRPQFVKDLAFSHLKLLLCRYSRGDDIGLLGGYLPLLVEYWEQAENLADRTWPDRHREQRLAFSDNINLYVDCLWLVALCILIGIESSYWKRLLALIGNEGQDALLDSLIAVRSPDRRVGRELCFPKPYLSLYKTITSRSAPALSDFVAHWYENMAAPGGAGVARLGKPPYWYNYHQPMKGAYFGFWCLEAAAVAKAFSVHDLDCAGHPNYPGDFLRPGMVTPPDLARLPLVLQRKVEVSPPTVGEPKMMSTWDALKQVLKGGRR